MPLKKHIRFNYKQIGVFIFFFLNCFLTAIPIINASAENIKCSTSSGFPSQNHPPEDPDDNVRPGYSDEQQEYHFAIRSRQKIAQLSNTKGHCSALFNSYTDKDSSTHTFASSSFLVKPAYYTFLSRYKLF
ncbi:MAG: hypothetical protein ABIT58_05975 [Ferruginibacter sp.]